MELCQDRYERYDYRNWDRLFRKEYLFNPKGPRKEQHGGYSHRVIKSKKVGASGGLFSRRDLDPALAKNYVSFRCAKSLSQKDSKLEKHVGQQ